jgi:hypothetical protein
MITDNTPSNHALEGIKLFLKDAGICDDFRHTPRPLLSSDFTAFKYILAMNQYQISRAHTVNLERLGVEFRLLGSFGGKGLREVAEPECIGDREWFEVRSTRIYPGYERCFQDIKDYIHDFVQDVFSSGMEFQTRVPWHSCRG